MTESGKEEVRVEKNAALRRLQCVAGRHEYLLEASGFSLVRVFVTGGPGGGTVSPDPVFLRRGVKVSGTVFVPHLKESAGGTPYAFVFCMPQSLPAACELACAVELKKGFGVYSFENVPSGSCRIRAFAAGCLPACDERSGEVFRRR